MGHVSATKLAVKGSRDREKVEEEEEQSPSDNIRKKKKKREEGATDLSSCWPIKFCLSLLLRLLLVRGQFNK
jgi:hypothetical protein